MRPSATATLLAAFLAALPAMAGDDVAPVGAPEGGKEEAFHGSLKGELSSLGSSKLMLHDTRIGLRAGISKISPVFYVHGSLIEFDLRKDKLGVGLGIPVRISAYDPQLGLKPFPEGASLRAADYDELSELMRVVRYITYGKKEENIYLNVGTEYSGTIGHGAAIRRYLANTDVDRGRVSLELDSYGKFGGGELMVGDVLRPQQMFGVLGFVKPFGNSKKLAAERLSFGLSYAADLFAPYLLKRDVNGLPALTGEGTLSPVVAESRTAQVIGLSVETKVHKDKTSDIKPFLELSKLIGGGAGLSLGALGRFTPGDLGRHQLRGVVELRAHQGNYLPGYFDSFYEVQRYQYITGPSDPINDQTKLFDVVNRPTDLKLGYYFELQYARRDLFAVTLAWEDSTARGGRNLVLHGEVPVLSYLRAFASFQRRSVEGPLFALGQHDIYPDKDSDNTLFFSGLRLKLLPIMYVNARWFREWKIDRQSQAYRNIDGFEFDIEIGYEFGDAKNDSDVDISDVSDVADTQAP